MKLEVPLKPLFDCPVTELKRELAAAPDGVWDIDDSRSKRYAVHRQTRSIVFKWLENTWRPGTPALVQDFDYAPPSLAQCALAMSDVFATFYGGKVVKLMLAELPAGAQITPHHDTAPALEMVHRCHVPVVTNAGVDFFIDNVPHQLKAGTAYEVDNTRLHAVLNRGLAARVHLICDVMPD